MKVHLLDTCALLWWMDDSPQLPARARRVIASRQTRILVSVASLWEIAIKRRKRRLHGVDEYLARHQDLHEAWGFNLLAIEPVDAVAAGVLDIPHTDPFDRMLIVQSKRVGAPVVTCDEAIARFAHATVW